MKAELAGGGAPGRIQGTKAPRRQRFVAVAALLALGLLITAGARASFTGPVLLSQAGVDGFGPQVAVADDGDAVAAWRSFDGSSNQIIARTISATGARGPVVTMTGAGQDAASPEVEIDDDGDAFVAWRRFKGSSLRIQARSISPASELGPTLTLSADGHDATDPAVAVDSEGDAIVAWRRFDGANDRVQARTISAAGDLGPILTLSAPGEDASGPQVSMDDDGDAVAVWRRFDGSKYRIQGRLISASGVVGAILDLSAASVTAAQARIGVDADGDAIAAWIGNEAGDERIEARPISSSGVLRDTVNLLSGSDVREPANFPDLAIDADGDAMVIWARPRTPGYYRVRARRISVDGTVGSPLGIASSWYMTPSPPQPKVGIDADGNAVVLWSEPRGTPGGDRVLSLTISPSDVESNLQSVSGQGQALNFQVGMGAGGNAVAVWEHSDGANSRIEVSRGP